MPPDKALQLTTHSAFDSTLLAFFIVTLAPRPSYGGAVARS